MLSKRLLHIDVHLLIPMVGIEILPLRLTRIPRTCREVRCSFVIRSSYVYIGLTSSWFTCASCQDGPVPKTNLLQYVSYAYTYFELPNVDVVVSEIFLLTQMCA